MPNFFVARDQMVDSLRRELVGPDPQGAPIAAGERVVVEEEMAWMPRRQENGEEILVRDSPDRRYGVGVLYCGGNRIDRPRVSEVLPSEGPPPDAAPDDEPDRPIVADDFVRDATAAVDRLDEPETTDPDLSGANEYRPTTMAVSFLADVPIGSSLELHLVAGRYEEREVNVSGGVRTWWFRIPCSLDAHWDGGRLRHRGTHIATEVRSENLEPVRIEAFAVSRPRDDGQTLLTVGILNQTPGSTPNHFLYQVRFTVAADGPGQVLPYPEVVRPQRDDEEESLDLLYRDWPTFAIGHGCAAEWDIGQRQVVAEPLPTVETPSITPDILGPDDSPVRVPMAPLAGLIQGRDGMESLTEVIALYEAWIADREAEVSSLEPRHRNAARRHLDNCRRMADRMTEGLALIRGDQTVAHAFRLANEAILLQQVHSAGSTREMVFDERLQVVRHREARRAADPLSPPDGRGAWRPFQIAFLLASIPSTADPSHPDRLLVDLIFFPTGGGKTEAYLGLAAFSIFLRRLRNPNDAGVDVLMRYTLRLLTAQQFQRAGSLVCAMEHIRALDGGLGTSPFRIGIWVGGDTSPNRRQEAVTALRSLRADRRAENPFLVIRCPWCAAQIGPLKDSGRRSRSRAPRVLGYDEAGNSVRISCTDPECEFSGGLPMFVIDEDIYEHRPAIIIGTVDKFAQLAWHHDARSIFGIGETGEHEVSPPGLIIQDELHLISGPLGSMVGLYEAVIDELCSTRDSSDGRGQRPKIISSTATIRRYQEQVRALFARDDVSLFPPHGLNASDSFFARHARYAKGHERAGELREGRLYVGVHGGGLGSVQTAQVRTFTALLQAGMDIPEDSRDPYWTLMTFFNSLRELGTSLSLLQSDIPDYMKVIRNRRATSWDRVRRLNREIELTARLQNDQVPFVMEELSQRHGLERDAIDVCLASSIIEVGIDIDRLSLMAVVGQPKTTSQYIQVTGRVGRKWEERPGLIVTIYSPTKPRDRSHFEKFRTYHERLYAQVEPTSVTPFAPPVLERALHAVLVSWVRQRLRVGDVGTPYPVPEAELAEIANVLRDRVNVVDPDELAALERFLSRRVDEWRRWLPGEWQRQSGDAEPGLLYGAGSYADPDQRVRSWATPRSLRDVDAECQGVITGIYALAAQTAGTGTD